ncbi:MAG: pentapeptide repeat-containing protein [Nostoc sp. DedQUE01]|nr:pentapeptide repeat-containing protein [Nostoc sp. DedQUE11]MDZ8075026.1 pentapeptide repeat-containing protein [Nostoc sp. DedQUE01]MDZ8082577.1 pentapeptide repeat-containing protein [Nostoc sp. DcaGUA01]
MLEIIVILKRYDGIAERKENISLKVKLSEVREAAQTLLGLPEKPPCRLVLYRTSSTLEDDCTLEEAGIQQNDRIILYPLDVWHKKNAQGYFVVHTPPVVMESEVKPSSSEPDISSPKIILIIKNIVKKSQILFKVLSLIVFNKTKKILGWVIQKTRNFFRKENFKKIDKKSLVKPAIFLSVGFFITHLLSNPELESTRTIWGISLGITKNAQGKNLNRAFLEAANLTNVNMVGTNLNGARLSQANLSNARLNKASLAGADLRGVNFSRADLTETNLNGANLLGANLLGANLRKAKITDPETGEITAKLDQNAKLIWKIVNESTTGRDLKSKKLDRYNLSYANLKNSVLSRASLTWVDLSKANLEGATLYKADLTGTNLRGANLKDVDLRAATLYKVKTDTSTICPNGKSGPCKF